MPATAAGEILERTSAFFESVLWDSEVGIRVQRYLGRSGIGPEILREFRVGYAPGDTQQLLDHLGESDRLADELTAAGLATRSGRSHVHVLFHARIMFPITDIDGGILGFAGLATHLGPSWPLWLTSPEEGGFDATSSLFGIRQAAAAIEEARRALVVRDPVQVLALHQTGRRDVVGVIHSPITRYHTHHLATLIRADDLDYSRQDGTLGVVALPAGAEVEDDCFAPKTTPGGISLIDAKSRSQRRQALRQQAEFTDDDRHPPTRPIVYLAGIGIGIGIPLGILALAAPHNEAAEGSTPTLNIVIAGMAVAYAVLAVVVGRISSRVRAQSKTRRMREPWARGSGEWQPRGWTYHRLEEILVGAALVSAVTALVLWMTIGGFLG
jgi:hypothetical protein